MQIDEAGARLLLPEERAARHAHVVGRCFRRRRRQPGQGFGPYPHLRLSRRGAAVAAGSPAPSRSAGLEEPFVTTRDLAGLIEIVTPRKAKDKIHPATRVFQALRIFVNDELGELAQGAVCRRARAEAGRAAGGRHLPFAGRPDRQEILPGSRRQGLRFAASAAGARACGNLRTSWQAYGGGQRRRSVPQSARPVCQDAGRQPAPMPRPRQMICRSSICRTLRALERWGAETCCEPLTSS